MNLEDYKTKITSKGFLVTILVTLLVISATYLVPEKAHAAPVTMWKTTKTYKGISYGGWQTQGVRKKSNSTGTVSFSVESKIATEYSGALKVSKANVESTLGFKLSSSQTYKFTNTWNVKKYYI
ncbi:hypothetical protein BOQ23_14140 [Listeria monocytogenes]|nr:hypothetical protein [Listeria monocytogenes]